MCGVDFQSFSIEIVFSSHEMFPFLSEHTHVLVSVLSSVYNGFGGLNSINYTQQFVLSI